MSSAVRALDLAPEEQSREWWRGYGFTGRLSEVDYYLWFAKASAYYDNPDFVPTPSFNFSLRERMTEEFELLRKSDFIMENFFKLPNVLRQCVEQFASFQTPIEQIEKFVQLALLLPAFDESVFTSDGKSNPLTEVLEHLIYQVRCASSSESVFDECMTLFQKYNSFSDPSTNDGLIQQPVVLMLALVYGAPFVFDLIRKWTISTPPASHDVFVSIVENWDDSYSALPMHWIANLVRGESNE